ncbi:MAG: hypothetical protein HY303_05875, partial [Candidatus Wallbacteria bacterium]|nr:hypothetical protein [Candidatus Wallbacteria bacterium]
MTKCALQALAVAAFFVCARVPAQAQPAGAVEKLNAASHSQWITLPSPDGRFARKLWGAATPAYAGKAHDAASQFLKDNASLLGVSGDLSDVELYRSSPGSGSSHVWYRRKAFGLPIEQSVLAVHFDALGRVVMVDNVTTEVSKSALGGDSVDAETAKSVAFGAAGSPGGVNVLQVEEKVLYVEGGVATPAWKVNVGALRPMTSRVVLVSALDGSVLESRDMLYRASGQVFAPNPVVYLHNFNLTDQSDSDAAVPLSAYRQVVFDINSPTFGPNNSLIYRLKGADADVYSHGLS